MSKRRSLCLAALVLGALLTACTGGESTGTQPPSILPGTTATQGTQEETVTAVTDATEKTEVTIEETVLYSENGVTVTATALENSLFGPTIRITATNESDKNLVITTQRLSVNGYMMTTSSLYCDVAAGKKANDELMLMSAELEQTGIETVGEVAFTLHISDSDTYETVADSDLITLKTSAHGTFSQSVDDSGEQVYDKHNIRVVCKGLKQDVVWDGTVVFYIENNSDRPITVYAEKVSINGYMVDVSLWADLRAGTRAIDGMYLMDLEELALSDIHGVENMEFTLRIVDGDNWSEIDTTDPITLQFQ